MQQPRVNLFSDTQTKPTAGMRRAMADAEVGDEQLGADPTVNALCARVAELLGKEAAVFLPSGTMCNEIAIRLHIRPGGDAAFMHRLSHPLHYEAGGPAALSGAVTVGLDGERGTFTADALRAALFAGGRYAPRNRLVCVEQPTYGHVWALDDVRAVLAVASEHGMRAHLDGARLMNAVVATGVSAADWADGFDTAWLDFTKGLGAPVGAVLAGSRELIDEAWRHKQMLGGAMRQAGIVAAGARAARARARRRGGDQHRGLRGAGRRRVPRAARGTGCLDGGPRSHPGARGDASRRRRGRDRRRRRRGPGEPLTLDWLQAWIESMP